MSTNREPFLDLSLPIAACCLEKGKEKGGKETARNKGGEEQRPPLGGEKRRGGGGSGSGGEGGEEEGGEEGGGEGEGSQESSDSWVVVDTATSGGDVSERDERALSSSCEARSRAAAASDSALNR